MGDLTQGFCDLLDTFLFFNGTKFLIFNFIWKLYTIDRWYSHYFFAVKNINKSPCQITDITIIISLNFGKIIFQIVYIDPAQET